MYLEDHDIILIKVGEEKSVRREREKNVRGVLLSGGRKKAMRDEGARQVSNPGGGLWIVTNAGKMVGIVVAHGVCAWRSLIRGGPTPGALHRWTGTGESGSEAGAGGAYHLEKKKLFFERMPLKLHFSDGNVSISKILFFQTPLFFSFSKKIDDFFKGSRSKIAVRIDSRYPERPENELGRR